MRFFSFLFFSFLFLNTTATLAVDYDRISRNIIKDQKKSYKKHEERKKKQNIIAQKNKANQKRYERKYRDAYESEMATAFDIEKYKRALPNGKVDSSVVQAGYHNQDKKIKNPRIRDRSSRRGRYSR